MYKVLGFHPCESFKLDERVFAQLVPLSSENSNTIEAKTFAKKVLKWDRNCISLKLRSQFSEYLHSTDLKFQYNGETNTVTIEGDDLLQDAINSFLNRILVSADLLVTLKKLFPDDISDDVFELWMSVLYSKLSCLKTCKVDDINAKFLELTGLDSEGSYFIKLETIWEKYVEQNPDKKISEEPFLLDSGQKWAFYLSDLAEFASESGLGDVGMEKAIVLKLLRWKLALEAWEDQPMVLDREDKRLKLVDRDHGLVFYAMNGDVLLGYEIEFVPIVVDSFGTTKPKMILHNVNSVSFRGNSDIKGLTPAAIFWVHYMVCMNGFPDHNIPQCKFDGSLLSRVGSFISAIQARSTLEKMIAASLSTLSIDSVLTRHLLYRLSCLLGFADSKDRGRYVDTPWSMSFTEAWCKRFELNAYSYNDLFNQCSAVFVNMFKLLEYDASDLPEPVVLYLRDPNALFKLNIDEFESVFTADVLTRLPRDLVDMVTVPSYLRRLLHSFGSATKHNMGKLVGLELITRLFRELQYDRTGKDWSYLCVEALRDELMGYDDKFMLDLNKLFGFSEELWSFLHIESLDLRVSNVKQFIETNGIEVFTWCLIFYDRSI